MSSTDRPPRTITMSTDSVDEHERFDFWREVVSRLFVEMELQPLGEVGRFSGSVTGLTAGSVRLSRVTAGPTPHHAVRTPGTIARADENYFMVKLVLNGTAVAVNDERSAVLRPGDLVLHDTSCPHSVQVERDIDMFVMQIPQTLMWTVLPQASSATAVTINGREGTAALIRPLLNELLGTAGNASPVVQRHLMTTAIELVAASLVDRTAASTGTPLRAADLARVRGYVEQHLSDRDLSPETVARTVRVSERHLHTLFRDIGMPFACYVMERRLDKAYRDLTDNRLMTLSVADIATRLGFTSTAHLTDAFTARFGVGPREHRNGGLPPQDPGQAAPLVLPPDWAEPDQS